MTFRNVCGCLSWGHENSSNKGEAASTKWVFLEAQLRKHFVCILVCELLTDQIFRCGTPWIYLQKGEKVDVKCYEQSNPLGNKQTYCNELCSSKNI